MRARFGCRGSLGGHELEHPQREVHRLGVKLLLPAGPAAPTCLGVAPSQQVLAPAPAPALDRHDGKVRGALDQHIAGL